MYAGELIVAGLVSGAVYALIALGLVVIYKASNVLNFAHGHISALAAFVTFSLIREANVPVLVVVPVAIAVSLSAAMATEVLVISRLKGERPLTILVATLGVSLVLSGLMHAQWGPSPKVAPILIQGRAFDLVGISVSWNQVVIVLSALVLVLLLGAFFRYTTFGIAMRAASESQQLASLLGINGRAVSLVSWAIGGSVGAVAAILVAPQLSLTPDQFTHVMIQAFAAVVLAGFTNIVAAVIGGFLTGVSLNLFVGFVASDMPSTFLLALLLTILLVRPHGLFGRQESVQL